MAIFGTLEEVASQIPAQELLVKGIEFLETADLESLFDNVEDGKAYKHEIEGDELFASFQQYNTKQPETPKFEGHKKYIDIQFIFDGEEYILNGSIKNITTSAEYNETKDVYFPKLEEYTAIKVKKGDAAVLFPCDIHAPCQTIGDTPVFIRKIVLKVAVA
ncbi:YhcH/YjgK/YiaL family protein [Halosquirtibacter xylanolyticus]|uniref:YhcH/YjgK/YiaL family protein n=1 Tax=Halosquirtibacter xylanolyticus TaxID=3374599 RepID=UPI00374A5AEC|nr:YhcH/YjgK/YiaL family protein [Prolixibacteraceae bacterium]